MIASAQLTFPIVDAHDASVDGKPRRARDKKRRLCPVCRNKLLQRTGTGRRKRQDAKTCSKSCRQKLSRRLKQKRRARRTRRVVTTRKPVRRRELLTNAARRRALEGVTL